MIIQDLTLISCWNVQYWDIDRMYSSTVSELLSRHRYKLTVVWFATPRPARAAGEPQSPPDPIKAALSRSV
jgi:hypothetical protein